MSKYNLHFFLFILFGLTVVACTPKTIATETEYEAESANATIKDWKTTVLDYSTFEGVARTSYSDGKKSLNFKTTFRIQKDETIWVSASLLGFEAARALITPDSVKVINRIEREYYVEPIERISEIANLPINFETFQNLLVGDILMYNPQSSSVIQQPNQIVISSQSNQLVNEILFAKQPFSLIQQQLNNKENGQQMQIIYGDTQSLNNSDFAYERSIVATDNEDEVNVSLNFTKVSVNEELSFPFSINERYERKTY